MKPAKKERSNKSRKLSKYLSLIVESRKRFSQMHENAVT